MNKDVDELLQLDKQIAAQMDDNDIPGSRYIVLQWAFQWEQDEHPTGGFVFFCSHIRKISKSLKKAIHNIKTDNFNFMFEVNWKTICPYGRAA